MGQIQQNINSMIGSAAILAGLYANTPAGRAKGEARVAAATAKKHGKAVENLKGATYTGTPAEQEAKRQVVQQQIQAHTEAQLENLNTAAMANPNQRNVAAYTQTQAKRNMQLEAQDRANLYADDSESPVSTTAAEVANNRAGTIAEVQGQQKLDLEARLKLFRESPIEERREFMRRAGRMQAIHNRPKRYTKKEEEV